MNRARARAVTTTPTPLPKEAVKKQTQRFPEVYQHLRRRLLKHGNSWLFAEGVDTAQSRVRKRTSDNTQVCLSVEDDFAMVYTWKQNHLSGSG
ncbi:hypothetical protein PGIGA_G00133370 [Pangasianodon gigas]|uniref:Uncharacterized protein n=1 Tax=Pangasianodon gigas TaxID=30993 RepID=A0ACC5XJE6_PANGG|nr:hypothetical protein [Pangasianodon gigas]